MYAYKKQTNIPATSLIGDFHLTPSIFAFPHATASSSRSPPPQEKRKKTKNKNKHCKKSSACALSADVRTAEGSQPRRETL